ncbi:ribonuclease R [Stackebrandtia endophytica]|uniref:Ribonuclease R n=1 Tax=Stackebrandtia endophytica TaxID=1496996 RepID=A0A543B016_9ACTN|nr:RNB domain-containing ribonuclease [Stackebrandtia endophytica]TQL78177.1 ribonuclease R [Stackebrandtia endophytica]
MNGEPADGVDTDIPDAQHGIMIDSPTTTDRDDAIWVRPREDRIDVWVHIADVASHFAAATPADATARRRVHTRYGRDRVIGMLPQHIESAATLRTGVAQTTMTVHIGYDSHLEPVTVELSRGRLTRAHQLAYPDVSTVIDDGDHPLRDVLGHAHDLATGLLARRRRNGALAFYDLYKGYASTEEGNLIRLAEHQRNVGYLIVQEFMIAANTAVSRWAAHRDLPILYRNHRTATVGGGAIDILDELAHAQATGDAGNYELLRDRLRVVQRAAEYSPIVLGHHGLNLATYTHASSPLRRYPDLVNQRIILAHVDGRPQPYPIEEVTALAEEANQQYQLERQRRAERHRDAAKRITRGQLDTPDHRHLDDTEFSKVLRLAVATASDQAGLIDEADRRFTEGRLSMRDLYELLLRAEGDRWLPVRERAHRAIADEPGNALTVLNMYVQAEVGGPVSANHLQWQVQPIGTAHQPCFEAQLTMNLPDRTVDAHARAAMSKKDAKAQAALSMLSRLSGLPDLSRNTEPPPEPAGTPARVPDDRNATMAVNEYAQTKVINSPTWHYDRRGPSHEPTFTCTAATVFGATGEPLTAQSAAPSKQAAKSGAAQILRTLIEERLDEMALTRSGAPDGDGT